MPKSEMSEAPGPAFPPAPVIPAQRAPVPGLPDAAVVRPPLGAGAPGAQKRRRRGLAVVAVLLLIVALVVTIGAMIRDPRAGPAAAAVADAPSAVPVPRTPYELLLAVTKEQAAALLRGDEPGWLAAVDRGQPKLRKRYRGMYRSLRALGVSQFEYRPSTPTLGRNGAITTETTINFCFSMDACPRDMAPTIRQTLTFKSLGGRYTITGLAKSRNETWLQPTPWEGGNLVFAQGKRVTVAGAPSQAKHLEQVAALADKAASVADRVAGFVGNPQQRYRVFIADNKSWRSWYGGESGKWTTGLEIPLNRAQSDVVLKMSALRDRAELARTLQHELGHVATVGGATEENDFLYRENQWLSEGVAEYVEWSPRGATASYRRTSVRLAVRGSHRPKSIVAKPLSANASDRTIDAFYGLGHFAVDCMAQEFGQRKMFDFIRLRLRLGEDLDRAARHAYGMPFATVDKACVAWIRQRA